MTPDKAPSAEFVKDEGETLLIEGVRYAKALLRELGINGVARGTLFRLENRDNGVITITTLKWDEAIKQSEEAAYERGYQHGLCDNSGGQKQAFEDGQSEMDVRIADAIDIAKETAREKALEEAAKLADDEYGCDALAEAIRALKRTK